MSNVVACSNCGAENDAEQRFCGSCGASLTQTCQVCGVANPPAFRFCGNCGSPLPGGQAADELRPARGPVREERRLATVLFADISGFTNLSERMDPEDVRTLVDACMAKLGDIVTRYGGRVDNVIGDALMAEFGADVAHGDDPERAVRAALEMQHCATANVEEFGGLALRVGVNTGEVMFAPVGPDSRREFTVIGDAVNVAQRLETAAPPGSILVGDETYGATRKAIRYEPGDPAEVTVKGKEFPLRVWRPLAAVTVRPTSTAGLVGRDSELGLLRSLWERTSGERRPRLITVVGDVGIGKSRLAEELVAHVEERGGRVLWGRSLPYGEATGFGAFAQQVKQLAGIFETDAPAEAREKLESAVARLLPADTGDVSAHVGLVLGLESDRSAPDKTALFYSCRRLVEAAAAELPTALVFEDVHWAEGSLLELVETLAARVQAVPLLVLTLARLEFLETRPSWAAGVAADAHTRLPLEPLTADESRALALRLLSQRAEPVATEILERLSQTAEGNPLFIEELAASLAERATDSAAELPTTVKGIIAARLDALPAAERAVVLDASVLGKHFWRGALERLSGNGGGLAAVLDSLERRDLVRRQPVSSVEGDEEYWFKHLLIREIAYATLPKSARRERHEVVARYVEEAAGERVAESAAILAHHWREAGDGASAVRYLLLAAEHAGRAWAKTEAVALYDQALALMPESGADARRKACLERAIALFDATDYHGALSELEALLPHLAGEDLFWALYTCALAAYWMADSERASLYGRRGAELAEELGDDGLRAISLGLLSPVSAMDGDVPGALELGAEALGRWRPGFRPERQAVLRSWLAIDHYWLGGYEEAVAQGLAAYELGLETYNVEAVLTGGAHHGLALAGLGRHDEALEAFARVEAFGREHELQPRFTARLTNMWAGTLRELYDFDGARRLNEEAVDLGARAGFPPASVSGRIDLLVMDVMEGAIGRAEREWPDLWKRAGAIKGFHQWLWLMRLTHAKAEIELAARRLDSAAETALDAIARAERYGRRKYAAAARLTLGSTLLELGRAPEAAETLRLSLAEAEGLGHPPAMWRAAGELSRALAAAGDDDGAAGALHRAREILERFAAGLPAERRDPFLRTPQLAELLAAAR